MGVGGCGKGGVSAQWGQDARSSALLAEPAGFSAEPAWEFEQSNITIPGRRSLRADIAEPDRNAPQQTAFVGAYQSGVTIIKPGSQGARVSPALPCTREMPLITVAVAIKLTTEHILLSQLTPINAPKRNRSAMSRRRVSGVGVPSHEASPSCEYAFQATRQDSNHN